MTDNFIGLSGPPFDDDEEDAPYPAQKDERGDAEEFLDGRREERILDNR